MYLTTIKSPADPQANIVNNEFQDVYIFRTNLAASDMTRQESEVAEIFYVTHDQLKLMIDRHRPDLVKHDEEYRLILEYLGSISPHHNK